MVLSGKIRAAVRMVTDCDPGGLLCPDDKCSKTQRPVIDILRKKRPEARIPSKVSFHEHPNAEDCLETMPTFCHEDNVVKRALNIKGGARPCGVEGIMLRNWLLRHKIRSEKLRKEMAHWTKWLSNESPPYVAYYGLNACRQLAADKCTGV